MRGARDERGATSVQSLLFIAIFVLLLTLSIELYKVVSIKQSIHAAAYQAAKFVALNGMEWGLNGHALARQMRPFVVAELQNNPFLPADSVANARIGVWVNAGLTPYNYCDRGQFEVRVELPYEVYIPPRFGQAQGGIMRLTLGRSVAGQFQCRQ